MERLPQSRFCHGSWASGSRSGPTPPTWSHTAAVSMVRTNPYCFILKVSFYFWVFVGGCILSIFSVITNLRYLHHYLVSLQPSPPSVFHCVSNSPFFVRIQDKRLILQLPVNPVPGLPTQSQQVQLPEDGG